ncbi:MAG TPA: hypothetical protein VFK57_01580 [Vicinamibacterales bacterium]|nr:hypothetical protein [Vicinamibacterales bacterium]
MAKWAPPPEISPWRRRGLMIPPDSPSAWIRLATWEFGMGVLVYAAVGFGAHLIASAPHSIVTVFDLTNCYAAAPVTLPCERVAYRVGTLNAALNVWCGLLLTAVAAWVVWDLWSAAAPKPITDDFLKLLEDSFARDWRKPRTWPWSRIAWAYGFAIVGVTSAAGMSLLLAALSASPPSRAPTVRIETSEQFRVRQ